jgi:hypoxanthine phosphoribosyltransferase
MADTVLAAPEVLLSEDEVRRAIDALAAQIAPHVDDETVAVCLLTGGIWFAADLTRALSRLGRNLLFDCLWVGSYGDAHETSGKLKVHANLQRPVTGRKVLLLDDVFDSGLCLTESVRMLKEQGATEVLTAVFARKPYPKHRPQHPDFIAWEAPGRYLVGYGLDSAGAYRGVPFIGALD